MIEPRRIQYLLECDMDHAVAMSAVNELLAACREVAEWEDNMDMDSMDKLPGIIERVHAAIAKAEGRPDGE